MSSVRLIDPTNPNENNPGAELKGEKIDGNAIKVENTEYPMENYEGTAFGPHCIGKVTIDNKEYCVVEDKPVENVYRTAAMNKLLSAGRRLKRNTNKKRKTNKKRRSNNKRKSNKRK